MCCCLPALEHPPLLLLSTPRPCPHHTHLVGQGGCIGQRVGAQHPQLGLVSKAGGRNDRRAVAELCRQSGVGEIVWSETAAVQCAGCVGVGRPEGNSPTVAASDWSDSGPSPFTLRPKMVTWPGSGGRAVGQLCAVGNRLAAPSTPPEHLPMSQRIPPCTRQPTGRWSWQTVNLPCLRQRRPPAGRAPPPRRCHRRCRPAGAKAKLPLRLARGAADRAGALQAASAIR